MSPRIAATRGFSLLEVVVALAVVAVALGAAVKAVASHATNQMRLEEKTFAHWVGVNRLTETLLDPVAKGAMAETGTETMGKRTWRWQLRTEETGLDGVRRVVVSVSPETSEVAVDRVVGFQRTPAK